MSEETARSLAMALRVEINRVLAVVHDIALGKDFKHFLKVAFMLSRSHAQGFVLILERPIITFCY